MMSGRRAETGTGLKAITVAAVLYLISVGVGPPVVYRLVTTNQDWGQFWRVAAGPIGTMLAAAGAVLAAYFAMLNGERSRRLDREITDQDRRAAIERDLRARFTSAAEQLGDQRTNVRQAGAYAMAAIADDWLTLAADEPMGAREAQVCIEVLCNLLRSTPVGEPANANSQLPSDQPVRNTIIDIITSHLRQAAEPSWRQLRFDLKGAHLHEVNLSDCHFGSLSLANAQFSGREAIFTGSHFASTTFEHARFHAGTTAEFTHTTWDETAVFQYTEFGGTLRFDDATFNADASFIRASLGTAAGKAVIASFLKAKFSAAADFTDATVCRARVQFDEADFSGPALFTRLSTDEAGHSAMVSFCGATFHEPADFEACRLGSLADFSRCIFLGTSELPSSLDDTIFDGEYVVKFNDAKFRMAEFGLAQFHRPVSFYGATWLFKARFSRTIFGAPVRFEKTTFHSGATFVGDKFVCGANFYRTNFGDERVDFTNPVVWNDVRTDWDGSSPFIADVGTQPDNVLPADWPPSVIE